MAAQALCCGYYGVFVVLMVGFARPRRGRDAAAVDRPRAFWTAIVGGAVVAVAAGAAGVPAVRHAAAGRRLPPRAEGRDAVLGQLERLPGELVVRARLDARATCRRGRRCRFPGFVAAGASACAARGSPRGDRRGELRGALRRADAAGVLGVVRAGGGAVLGALPRRADVRLAARAGALRADRRLRPVGAGRRGDRRRWLRAGRASGAG